ncbi:hypothetical protein [Streptomyces venezuelae]|uniref:hypothetical protein n=1 Tax=Streptomyces venezuelae TaxID=54571 RepID=UPI00123AEB87|nr:hypothetical protein [Streptomyces venezuelae]QES07928.1 hypothetical protein DEJ44_21490 [Streptomyces venezuelae]
MIKRRIGVATAALGLAALGLTVPGTAQAATEGATGALAGCADVWRAHQGDGNMWAFSGSDCSGTELGHSPSWDSDWSNSSGPFRGDDNDRATSLVNTGTQGGRDTVAFYLSSGYEGGHGCVTFGEKYVTNLNDDTFTSGVAANNAISSHQWVTASACSRFFH